jgi:hypothetical protein
VFFEKNVRGEEKKKSFFTWDWTEEKNKIASGLTDSATEDYRNESSQASYLNLFLFRSPAPLQTSCYPWMTPNRIWALYPLPFSPKASHAIKTQTLVKNCWL